MSQDTPKTAALPGESCALNEWGLTEVAALAQEDSND